MEVPFIDLKAQYPLIKNEILEKFHDIIDNSAFVSGKYVKEFEDKFAQYGGVKHCIALNTGTTALLAVLWSYNIGAGDEVIVPVNTFIATAEAVSLTGARPVFVDIDENTCLMDANKIVEKITPKTKAIIPVHLYGQCAPMNMINDIAQQHGLLVIEDACQAHGASFQGKKAGALSHAAAFSFYVGKNLGAWGEGGAVTTNDDELALKIRLMRDHGSLRSHNSVNQYYHEIIGGNFRMSEFQGATLATKIDYLEEWNEKRRKHANTYLKNLQNIAEIKLPLVLTNSMPVWHLLVVQADNRDVLMNYLKKNAISAGIHYPQPLHLTGAYKNLGYTIGDFPQAEKVASKLLSLPMYPEITSEEITYVCDKIKKFFSNKII